MDELEIYLVNYAKLLIGDPGYSVYSDTCNYDMVNHGCAGINQNEDGSSII